MNTKDFEYDFSGYATRCDLKCADGRIIRKGAFKDCDGKIVPVVWNHNHGEISNVVGHALLEARDDGMYSYISCNSTPNGAAAKEMVVHGDITSLSIYANHVRQSGPDVIHGVIREVSLVLAGANPGAYIDTIMCHSDDDDEEAVIYSGEGDGFEFAHSDEETEDEEVEESEENYEETEEDEDEDDEEEADDEMAHSDLSVGDMMQQIENKLSDEENAFITNLIGMALEKNKEGDSEDMRHSVFDNENGYEQDGILVHSADGDVYMSREDEKNLFKEAMRNGGASLKETCLAHGIVNIDYLFPEYQNLDKTPQYIKRDDDWVSGVLSEVHKTPFAKIKSTFADITGPEARARGYVKGNQKVEEVLSLLNRETSPTTVYKLQKFDRDDLIDADFDVVRWIRQEMEMMLKEELARAYLVGDGRVDGPDKINPTHIRPIYTDDDLFTVKVPVQVGENDTPAQKSEKIIDAVIRARRFYKGSGNPKFYTTEETLTEMLLIKDQIGHYMYDKSSLATRLRVSEIVTVPVMENLTRTVGNETRPLIGIIVNLKDYNVGTDKGGETTLFDDFDIDFNKQKYLIETRQSGALIKPHSALTIEYGTPSASEQTNEQPNG